MEKTMGQTKSEVLELADQALGNYNEQKVQLTEAICKLQAKIKGVQNSLSDSIKQQVVYLLPDCEIETLKLAESKSTYFGLSEKAKAKEKEKHAIQVEIKLISGNLIFIDSEYLLSRYSGEIEILEESRAVLQEKLKLYLKPSFEQYLEAYKPKPEVSEKMWQNIPLIASKLWTKLTWFEPKIDVLERKACQDVGAENGEQAMRNFKSINADRDQFGAKLVEVVGKVREIELLKWQHADLTKQLVEFDDLTLSEFRVSLYNYFQTYPNLASLKGNFVGEEYLNFQTVLGLHENCLKLESYLEKLEREKMDREKQISKILEAKISWNRTKVPTLSGNYSSNLITASENRGLRTTALIGGIEKLIYFYGDTTFNAFEGDDGAIIDSEDEDEPWMQDDFLDSNESIIPDLISDLFDMNSQNNDYSDSSIYNIGDGEVETWVDADTDDEVDDQDTDSGADYSFDDD
jgi:hypothetical protein